MFFHEMDNRFPNENGNGYTAMVIIEAIQDQEFTGIGLTLSGENDVYNQ